MKRRCANLDCPDPMRGGFELARHWIQVEELRVQTVGQPETLAAVQRPFAAVTCSHQCAIAVLTAEAAKDDAAKSAMEQIWASGRDSTE